MYDDKLRESNRVVSVVRSYGCGNKGNQDI